MRPGIVWRQGVVERVGTDLKVVRNNPHSLQPCHQHNHCLGRTNIDGILPGRRITRQHEYRWGLREVGRCADKYIIV